MGITYFTYSLNAITGGMDATPTRSFHESWREEKFVKEADVFYALGNAGSQLHSEFFVRVLSRPGFCSFSANPEKNAHREVPVGELILKT